MKIRLELEPETGKVSELIKEIELRNYHRVYREGADYRVEQVNPRREQVVYSYTIPSNAVEYLAHYLNGRKVTKEEASVELQRVANRFNLPYTYGHKLDYYAQEVLVVLVAVGKAKIHKEGRSYLYTIGHG